MEGSNPKILPQIRKFQKLIVRNIYLVNLTNLIENQFKSKFNYLNEFDIFIREDISEELLSMRGIISQRRVETINKKTFFAKTKLTLNRMILANRISVNKKIDIPLEKFKNIEIIMPVSGGMIKLFDFNDNIVYIAFTGKLKVYDFNFIGQLSLGFNTAILDIDRAFISEKFINYTPYKDLTIESKKTAYKIFLNDYYLFAKSNSIKGELKLKKNQLNNYYNNITIKKIDFTKFVIPLVKFKWDLGYSNLMISSDKYLLIDYDNFINVSFRVSFITNITNSSKNKRNVLVNMFQVLETKYSLKYVNMREVSFLFSPVFSIGSKRFILN
jgi:hypothetical protein